MALLSAVIEHNFQADLFSKFTPLLCLLFIPLSVCNSPPSASMPLLPPSIISIFAASVFHSSHTGQSKTVYIVLTLLDTPCSRQPFSVLVCFACRSLSFSHFSSTPLPQVVFPDSLFHLPSFVPDICPIQYIYIYLHTNTHIHTFIHTLFFGVRATKFPFKKTFPMCPCTCKHLSWQRCAVATMAHVDLTGLVEC